MRFTPGHIDGILRKSLPRFTDARGWLVEIFRADELPSGFEPAMAYISSTNPGTSRGPHEHVAQTDYFCFLGPFRVYLWDNRPTSATFGRCEVFDLDQSQATMLVIPPGVVHAYKNIGATPALVVNCPDRLYQGRCRSEPVDEIRHEAIVDSPFQLE